MPRSEPSTVEPPSPAPAVGSPPTVSVVLPVYNGSKFVRQAIDSILGQTFEDLELVIADNASSDGTTEICQAYAEADQRVRYYRQLENVGAARNFNDGFRHARGTYFKWASCDDTLEPTYVERCVAVLEADDDVSLVHTGVTCINGAGEETGTFELDRTFAAPDPYERFRMLMQAWDFSAIWGLMRRATVEKTRLLPVYLGSDRLFLTQIALRGRPHFIEDRLFRWRIHEESFRERDTASKQSSVSWWSTSVRSWPMRNTAYLLAHGSSVIMGSPLSLATKLRCERYFFGWALRPVLYKLFRRGRHGRKS